MFGKYFKKKEPKLYENSIFLFSIMDTLEPVMRIFCDAFGVDVSGGHGNTLSLNHSDPDGQNMEIQSLMLLACTLMPGYHMEGGSHPTLCHRDPRIGRNTVGGGNSRHDLIRDSMTLQLHGFLAAPPEYQRISTL